jgi:ribonuclease HI
MTKQQLFSSKETDEVVVYTDGGSRGNPGPSALGVVIQAGAMKKAYGEYLGNTTNNIAEYSAIVFALKKIKQLFGKEKAEDMTVKMFMDSELAVRQLNGEYKIENESLQPLWLQIWNLKIDFKKVTFTHVLREKNKGADKEVNRVLDAR